MQVLEGLRYVCYGGLVLSLVILTKLLLLGRKLNFINIMFVNVFFCEVILGLFMIPNFFKVGELNLTEETHLKEQLIGICGKWWALWAVSRKLRFDCKNKNENPGKNYHWQGCLDIDCLIFLHYSSLIKYIFSKKNSQTYLFIQVHILLYTLRRCSSFEHWNDFH